MLIFYIFYSRTDTQSVENEAIKVFGAEKIILNQGENIHLDRTSDLKCSDRVDRIFLDLHSLQNCNYSIISESGFGKLGVWNRLEPQKNLVMFSKKGKIVEVKSIDELGIL